jgi:hypothetical protein
MKHLTRGKFAKTMACEIGALSVLMSLAVATTQAQSARNDKQPGNRYDDRAGDVLPRGPMNATPLRTRSANGAEIAACMNSMTK